ncbi:MAG: hypothetical protein ACTSQD_02590 [Promethearchaeota archaeon]
MDIAKFNKELGTKIAMAKSFEKHDNSLNLIKSLEPKSQWQKVLKNMIIVK